MKLLLSILAVVVSVNCALAQRELRVYLTGNGNLYLPRKSNQQSYPILGYNGDADPKILIGGLGLGITLTGNINDRLKWHAQGNTSRRVFWDDPMLLTDPSNMPIGNVTWKGVDILTTITGALHYRLGKTLSVGTGLGVDALIYSYVRGSKPFVEETMIRNNQYRSLMPLIPVELSIDVKRFIVNLRYQHALLGRLKEPASQHKKDTYSGLIFELGYRLK